MGTGTRQRDRIIDESVLYRVIGDEEIMREQLLHLAQRAGRRHVTLLVLPLDSRSPPAPTPSTSVTPR
ncbi:Scr1 family TA system antitoxin-like transcriptional regulator [Streptomyces griseus]|uniref:Scr1 family TA system antitoxin-like transcriptional regulator n=1 Tax=Streptomyces griseus TaxID=1911 RepID=UPI0036848214